MSQKIRLVEVCDGCGKESPCDWNPSGSDLLASMRSGQIPRQPIPETWDVIDGKALCEECGGALYRSLERIEAKAKLT